MDPMRFTQRLSEVILRSCEVHVELRASASSTEILKLFCDKHHTSIVISMFLVVYLFVHVTFYL